MGQVSRYGKNDPHALTAIASGRLTADPDTGHVYLDGDITGAARPDGYITVSVPRLGGRGRVSVMAHRIVWMCNHAPIRPGFIVNHRNGMRWDNRLANLDMTTTTGNARHARLRDYSSVGGDDSHAVDPDWWRKAQHLITRGASYEEVAAVTPSEDPNPTVYFRMGAERTVRTGQPLPRG